MAWTVSKAAGVDGHGWCFLGTGANISAASETIKAAPGAGLYNYIEYLAVICVTAITVDIYEDTTKWLTLPFSTSGPFVDLVFTRPIKMTANKPLKIQSSGAGNVAVVAYGYVGP